MATKTVSAAYDISTDTTLATYRSNNPVLAAGAMVMGKKTVDGKTYYLIKKGDGKTAFKSLKWQVLSQATVTSMQTAMSEADDATYTSFDGDTTTYTKRDDS
jgi:hypothetical protein